MQQKKSCVIPGAFYAFGALTNSNFCQILKTWCILPIGNTRLNKWKEVEGTFYMDAEWACDVFQLSVGSGDNSPHPYIATNCVRGLKTADWTVRLPRSSHAETTLAGRGDVVIILNTGGSKQVRINECCFHLHWNLRNLNWLCLMWSGRAEKCCGDSQKDGQH